jgi:hypothetical protein
VNGVAERLVVEHAAIQEPGLAVERAPLPQILVDVVFECARCGRSHLHWLERRGKAGRDRGQSCERRHPRAVSLRAFFRRERKGERRLSSVSMFEMKHGAVRLDVDLPARRVDRRGQVAVVIRARHEQIELVKCGRPLRAPRRPGDAAHRSDGAFELRQIVVARVQQRRGVHLVVDQPEQLGERSLLAPERRTVGELPLVRERVGQKETVDAACRCAADDVDDDVRVEQPFQQLVHAAAAHGSKELLGDAVDVNGQRHTAVDHQPQAYFPSGSRQLPASRRLARGRRRRARVDCWCFCLHQCSSKSKASHRSRQQHE